MNNLLFPKLGRREWCQLLTVGLAGTLIAGAYGIVHDQVTYSLSPEYFTKFKFASFADADFGWGDRWFVATVGFLATWWVGLICGWVVARVALGTGACREIIGACLGSLLLIFAVTLLSGLLGYLYGSWRIATDGLDEWDLLGDSLRIDDVAAFAKVGYIHNFSYGGGVVGSIAAVIRLRRQAGRFRRRPSRSDGRLPRRSRGS